MRIYREKSSLFGPVDRLVIDLETESEQNANNLGLLFNAYAAEFSSVADECGQDFVIPLGDVIVYLFGAEERKQAAWTHLHNEYLQWWVEAGALGMGALVLLIWAHGFFFLRTRDRDWVPALGILAALCTACFFFTFQIGRLLFLAVLYAAMVQSAYLDRSQQGDS